MAHAEQDQRGTHDAAEKLLEETESNHEPDTWAEWYREPAKMRLVVFQKMFAWATTSASP